MTLVASLGEVEGAFRLMGGRTFLVGLYGVVLNGRSILAVLRAIELMLLGVNLVRFGGSSGGDDVVGEIYGFMVLTVAAAESAIGLALLVVYYQTRGTVAMETVDLLRG